MNPVGIRSVDRDSWTFSIGDSDVTSRRNRVCAFSGGVSGRESPSSRSVWIEATRIGDRHFDRVAITVNRSCARIAESLTAFQRHRFATLE